jgi:hypothetical protein
MSRKYTDDYDNDESWDLDDRFEDEMIRDILSNKGMELSSNAQDVIKKLGSGVNIVKVYEDHRMESCRYVKHVTYHSWYLWVIVIQDGVEKFLYFTRGQTYETDKVLGRIMSENTDYEQRKVYDDIFFQLLKIHY